MGAQRPSLDQVFILRFWREETEVSDQGSWRVMVRNINTRRRDVVDDVQRAFAIVAGSLDVAATSDSAKRSTSESPRSLNEQMKRFGETNE